MSMIKCAGKIILVTLFVLVSGFSFILTRKSPESYNYQVISVDNGWGYDIKIRKKTCIHQVIIPAISGNHPFPTRRSAKQAAELVVNKLNNHKPPLLTQDEVQTILTD